QYILRILTLSKLAFILLLFSGTSPRTPTSFGDPKKQKDCIFDTNLGFTSYFEQNLIIFYAINK
ncbi:hypothetical protein, partial [Brachyspira hyodysenteriae]